MSGVELALLGGLLNGEASSVIIGDLGGCGSAICWVAARPGWWDVGRAGITGFSARFTAGGTRAEAEEDGD
jgi:uncharacterized protein YceK